MAKRIIEKGLCELYAEDAERADWLVFGRRAGAGRRGFLKGAGLATMSAIVGAAIPFHRHMPAGLIPAALADELKDFQIEGKDGLVVLNDRPVNAETPAELLDDPVTPTERLFIRNHGNLPDSTDAQGWKLTVDGEVATPLELTIDDLKSRFEPVTQPLQLECAGNGRAAFNPPVSGGQWTVGAIGCPEWTGVRLTDVLDAAGLKPSAIYTAHYGADTHLSGDPAKLTLSRGVPIERAKNPSSLIVFELNGAPLYPMNGAPLRLLIPGWAGSCSQKWLTRISLRDQVHDGPGMTGKSYRVPSQPVEPGADVPEANMAIIGSMPVKSLITHPATNSQIAGLSSEVRGHAWAGDRKVEALDLSLDFGASWQPAELQDPVNPYAWQNWRAEVRFPQPGYYEVWARATDDQGVTQPFGVTWNPGGYLNNVMHRIALTVAG